MGEAAVKPSTRSTVVHKHVQVREYVRSLVGGAEPGTPAPSERELVQLFGVARMTVRQALDALVAEGLLERIPGRGTFVADHRLRAQHRMAQAELHYTPVGATAPQVVKQDVLLSFSADANAPAHDPRVMNLVEKVTAFKLQTRALSEAEAGNVAGATQKLRAAATRLLDLGELELAEKTNKQAEELEKGGGLSAAGQKELKYATRRLTQKLEE